MPFFDIFHIQPHNCLSVGKPQPQLKILEFGDFGKKGLVNFTSIVK